MEKIKRLNLQLFAEGGEGGGDGAATGAETANTGDADQRLRELGVPDNVLARRAKRNARKQGVAKAAPAPASEPAEPAEQTEEQDATAETEKPTEEKPARMSWDDIMKDPEYNKEMQKTVQARLRNAKASEDALGKLTPALEVLARKYGLDATNIDYDALSKAINDEDEYYEDKALEMGVSLETAKKIDQDERKTAREQAEQQRTLEQQKIDNHFRKMEQQGEELKKIFPGFDLRKELQNPVFVRMTSPGVGLSVEDAYYAIHRKEIEAAAMKATQRQTAEKMSRSIQSGMNRPAENGTRGQAPSATTFDITKASKAERDKYRTWVKAELAAGRKPRPGDYRG